APRTRLRGPALDMALGAPRAEPGAEGGIGWEGLHRGSELVVTAVREATAALPHELPDRPEVAGDDGRPLRERFECDEPECLVDERRHERCDRPGIERSQRLGMHTTQEADIRDVGRESFELAAPGAVARDQEACGLIPAEGVEERLRPFDLDEPADEEEVRAGSRQPGPPG